MAHQQYNYDSLNKLNQFVQSHHWCNPQNQIYLEFDF